jgi:hypothetical protein
MVVIAGLGPRDVAVVQSLLQGAGFACRVHMGIHAGFAREAILIHVDDVAAVKKVLAQYRLRDERGHEYPIPW